MKLTTTQAADILGLSQGQVMTLIKRGDLKDYGVKKAGTARHNYKLDEDEVRRHLRTAHPHPRSNGTNGHHAPALPLGAAPEQGSLLPAPGARFAALEKSVAALHEKLDRLLAVWT